MSFDTRLFDLDFLVYSSHKTATQTTAHTLRVHGFRCVHCHLLRDLGAGLQPDGLPHFLESFAAHNRRKLVMLTVFREPIERHISSFFQWYGEGAVREKHVPDVAATIIRTHSVADLQTRFIDELHRRTVPGMPESIDEMCHGLGVDVAALRYDTVEHRGVVELPSCRLVLFRFDALIYGNRLESLLTDVTGKPIAKHDANVSATKWYAKKFAEFKATLRIPRNALIDVYEAKRHLIDLFYPGEYESLLAGVLAKYGQAAADAGRSAGASPPTPAAT